jgi:hypothetical protein
MKKLEELKDFQIEKLDVVVGGNMPIDLHTCLAVTSTPSGNYTNDVVEDPEGY